jgi:hypothetical protein
MVISSFGESITQQLPADEPLHTPRDPPRKVEPPVPIPTDPPAREEESPVRVPVDPPLPTPTMTT